MGKSYEIRRVRPGVMGQTRAAENMLALIWNLKRG